jgi:ribosome-associated protein
LKLNQDESLGLARLCCRALDEKKAGDLRVIDVTELSSITNYIVIATATSEPHVRALRVELEKALDASKTRIVGVDGSGESGWAVMDAFDVMVHIFTQDTRARYRLEHLWRDGNEVSVEYLLTGKNPPKKKAIPAKPKANAKVPARKKARK